MDSRFHGNDRAVIRCCHRRKVPTLAEAGAEVHGLPMQSLDLDYITSVSAEEGADDGR